MFNLHELEFFFQILFICIILKNPRVFFYSNDNSQDKIMTNRKKVVVVAPQETVGKRGGRGSNKLAVQENEPEIEDSDRDKVIEETLQGEIEEIHTEVAARPKKTNSGLLKRTGHVTSILVGGSANKKSA